LNQSDQESDRFRAARLLLAGHSAEDIMKIFGRSRGWAYGIQKVLRTAGIDALAAKPRPEGPKKVDDRERQKVLAMICDHSPQDFGFESALWTRAIVGDLIYERLGIDVSLPTVGKILRSLGLSPQRPVHRAIEQNPEAVQRWLEEEFPAIREEAAQDGAELYFGDEASIRADYHSGTTWAPVGHTPVVASTGSKETVSMLSAITYKGAISFDVRTGSVNSEVFIEFVKKILKDAEGRKVYLIVDGASTHTSKMTRKWVESLGGQLRLFILPAYSPELNPDELVWKNVKHDQIGKSAPRSADDLHNKAVRALENLRQVPEVIQGFFRKESLAYITQ
jgi:transposase